VTTRGVLCRRYRAIDTGGDFFCAGGIGDGGLWIGWVIRVNDNPPVATLDDAREAWANGIAALLASLFKVPNLASNWGHGSGLQSDSTGSPALTLPKKPPS
jgi:hypothetical protein